MQRIQFLLQAAAAALACASAIVAFLSAAPALAAGLAAGAFLLLLAGLAACWKAGSGLSLLAEAASARAREEHAALPLGLSGDAEILARAVGSLSEQLEAAKSEAMAKVMELDDLSRRADDAVKQAQKASQMAEQAKEEGMLHAAERLEEMVGAITASSEDIARRMQDVSREAREQRGRMDAASMAMGEMNLAIADVSHNSSDASISTDNARQKAEEAVGIVNEAREAIQSVDGVAKELKENLALLHERAQSIDRIINMINDIADQTNLLALNAAIEAARAGEAGRGFAVVADEVRKLAEKTMGATKEVGRSISDIQQSTEGNVQRMDNVAELADRAASLAKHSGESVGEILDFARENDDRVRTIAAAAEEQSASSSEISRSVGEASAAMTDIDEQTESASHAVEDLAALSVELGSLIRDMKSAKSDELISWGGKLVLGVQEIDRQHRRLVDLVNALYSGMRSGKAGDVMGELLSQLVEYTVYHFDHEEKLFAKHGYPEAKAHHEVHEKLKAQVGDFVGKYQSGKAEVSMDLMIFLRDWLTDHIMRTDRRYAPFLKEHGER
ncbi:MAG: bacteriohemerythrin [Desulfovibrionaceae bacterium]